MNLRTIALTSVISIVSIVAAGALAIYALAPRAAVAMTDVAVSGMAGDGHRRHCAMLQDHGEHLGLVARRMLDLDNAQQAAFEPVSEALNAWGDAVRPLCEDRGTSVLDRLATIDEFAQLTSAAVSDARADFEVFHATLSEDQKATLEELAQHRQHRRGHRRWHR